MEPSYLEEWTEMKKETRTQRITRQVKEVKALMATGVKKKAACKQVGLAYATFYVRTRRSWKPLETKTDSNELQIIYKGVKLTGKLSEVHTFLRAIR